MEHERTSLLASTASSSFVAQQRPSTAPTLSIRELQNITRRASQLVEDGSAVIDYDDEDEDDNYSLSSLAEIGLDDVLDNNAMFTDNTSDADATERVDNCRISTEELDKISKTASILWSTTTNNSNLPSNESPVAERVRLSARKLRESISRNNLDHSGQFARMPSFETEPTSIISSSPPPSKTPMMTLLSSHKNIAKLIIALLAIILAISASLFGLGAYMAGPPRQPIGEYVIVEAHVGRDFWSYYEFYAGKDSPGSNGYITYVSREAAENEGIINVTTEIVHIGSMIEIYNEDDVRGKEVDWLAEDLAFLDQIKRLKDGNNDTNSIAKVEESLEGGESTKVERTNIATMDTLRNNDGKTDDNPPPPPKLEPFNPDNNDDEGNTFNTNMTNNNNNNRDSSSNSSNSSNNKNETFVYISSSATTDGPRNSIRLEGLRRFNRGLFIIDLRHMPAGCGTWPAFWLTDEDNWPVNGEIDIVEGVNYQNTAKTALHTTKECIMDNVPEGSKTGTWDTAVGIPNKKTGIPDMTFRYAQNCFVYDPHQWINQGCVAQDVKLDGRSLGMPLNANGGGVFALEWDPANMHLRSWIFSPHGRVPTNLRNALRTATNADISTRIAPDTNLWGLPYGYFPIGEGTHCPSTHFRNMRLVINLAFCGSVAGNRYFMDCPKQFKEYKTCNEWVASDPEDLNEAYWKIRGVYVYERAWSS